MPDPARSPVRRLPVPPYPVAPGRPLSQLLTLAAGHACVAVLSLLRRAPSRVTETLLRPALLLYPYLRPRHASRLRACFAASPFAGKLTLAGYYAVRLTLLLLGLKSHGRGAGNGLSALGARETDPGPRVEGMQHYLAAMESDRPVALIGLHAGLFEELHRVPPPAPGKPFFILTAPAFSPPLTGFMARGRERNGKRILWIGSKGPRGLKAGLRGAIAGKGVLALMADQHPGPSGDCEFLSLWGKVKAPYPGRLLRFLADRDFLFVPVSTRLEADGTSVFRYHAALQEPTPESIRGFLEAAIAAAPDQWNWSYPKIRV